MCERISLAKARNSISSIKESLRFDFANSFDVPQSKRTASHKTPCKGTPRFAANYIASVKLISPLLPLRTSGRISIITFGKIYGPILA